MKLVFATNNLHKLAEAKSILAPQYQIIGLSDIGCSEDIPETANTLEENSLLKAKFVSGKYAIYCFSDDTGLEVECLNGEPGVRSARYAGKEHNSALNRKKLLDIMQNKHNRKARFRTVITLIINNEVKQFEGVVLGQIATKEYGSGGFGYDSIFIPDGYNTTFACLSEEEKNSISHRGKALRQLAKYLETEKQL